MNIQNLTTLFFSIAFILFMMLLLGTIFISYILSKISEKKYKRAIIKIIQSKADTDILESIKNTYENYRIHGSFSYLSIIEINAILIAELRDGSYKKYANNNNDISEKQIGKLERLNKCIKDEVIYSDEKLNNVLTLVRALSTDNQKTDNSCSEIRLLFGAIQSFCNGRIFEKQNEIYQKDAEIKNLKNNRWLNRLGWAVGLVSGIITIITFLHN